MIGNLDFLKRADKLLGAGLTYADSLDAARNGAVPVVHVATKDSDQIAMAQITAAGGEAAYQYVVKAVELALAGADRRHRHRAAEQGAPCTPPAITSTATPSCSRT